MQVEIEVPAACTGDILSDLTVKRRARVREISSLDSRGRTLIEAVVPFATMLGYATAVRSMTQGEGAFSLEYAEHAPVPISTAKEEMNNVSF